MTENIKNTLQEKIKEAMRAKNQRLLGVLRLISAKIKQKEIDSRPQTGDQPLDEQSILTILDKMIAQRRESISQYTAAGRQELADQEAFEITVIQEFLPPALAEEEIDQLINTAIQAVGATSEKDMGKVMAHVKPMLQGRADIKSVSEKIKAKIKSLA